jgi:hypothetical protein
VNDIEAKALALVREVLAERGLSDKRAVRREVSPYTEALCRAIEAHEAFKQEVSDAVEEYKADQPYVWKQSASDYFDRFIIPKPKPDPLVEIMRAAGWANTVITSCAPAFRTALDALGFEIREKGQ